MSIILSLHVYIAMNYPLLTIVFLLAIPLLTASLSVANSPVPQPENGDDGAGFGGFFGPGGGFGIPGFGRGWGNGIIGGGYGSGDGGSGGGYSKGGIIRRPVVCKEAGPCYMKKLICPAKCFTSFSRSGKGFGGGGGGGSCTIDCQKSCTAYC